MPRSVAVVFVHGIMAENLTYAEPMRRAIEAKLPKGLRKFLDCRSVFWADLVRGHQQGYMHRARTTSDIIVNDIRRFFVEGLGDAAAYQKTRSRKNSSYFAIQRRITDKLAELDRREHPGRPLVLIGHSLGCHIASSYAWDHAWLSQKTPDQLDLVDEEQAAYMRQLKAGSPFKRLGTLAGLVTMGSNMPLFTFTFGPEQVFPITSPRPFERYPGLRPAFPGRDLPPALATRARWLNFYSRSDYLGFPLKPLNDDYNRETRIEDIVVRSENRLDPRTFVSPMAKFISAHNGYWTNRTVVSRTAEMIRDLMEADESA